MGDIFNRDTPRSFFVVICNCSPRNYNIFHIFIAGGRGIGEIDSEIRAECFLFKLFRSRYSIGRGRKKTAQKQNPPPRAQSLHTIRLFFFQSLPISLHRGTIILLILPGSHVAPGDGRMRGETRRLKAYIKSCGKTHLVAS
jgi:hypothetical protein